MNAVSRALGELHPVALSRRSWLFRVPPLSALVRWRNAFNPLYVQEVELRSPLRPEACIELIDQDIPQLWTFNPFKRFNVGGVVWRDGFTIFQVHMGRQTSQYLTARLEWVGGVTRIHARLGIGRLLGYVLVPWTILMTALGAFFAVGAIRGTAPLWIAMGIVVLLVSPLLLASATRGQRQYLIDYLNETIAAERPPV